MTEGLSGAPSGAAALTSGAGLYRIPYPYTNLAGRLALPFFYVNMSDRHQYGVFA